MASIDLSQEILASDVFRALKSSLKYCLKHILRSLRLYGDQALQRIKVTLQQSFEDFMRDQVNQFE